MSMGYAMAFHCWLVRCHSGGFTYRHCDWRSPSVRYSWVSTAGPIVGMKVQSRNWPIYGAVTDVCVIPVMSKSHRILDIQVTTIDGNSLWMGNTDFNQHWSICE